jgi:hypothetical protein
MALIREFELRPLEPARLHDTVTCGFASATIAGQRILQLETYGTERRKVPGKVSQSIQLDEAGARELKKILERTFPGI